jgi:hypothetical protein
MAQSDNNKGHRRLRWWPKLASCQMHPRHDKEMRDNPNYRIAIGALICVKGR